MIGEIEVQSPVEDVDFDFCPKVHIASNRAKQWFNTIFKHSIIRNMTATLESMPANREKNKIVQFILNMFKQFVFS